MLARQLASALSAVHAQRFVHRDIKPANILLGDDGAARLIDFGLAGGTDDRGANKPPVGTLLYAAPERNGSLRLAVDGRADLYSLGVVLYEALTGVTPFVSDSVDELIRKHGSEPAPQLKHTRPDVSATLSAVVDKLLAKDPDDRYQSGASLLYDLEQLTTLAPNRLGQAHADARLEALLPLFGRNDEMAKLVARLAQAEHGQGSVVVLSGERGIGKTRIVQELERRAISGQALVVSAKRGTDTAPLAAVRSMLEQIAQLPHRLPEAERAAFHLRMVSAAGEYAPFLARACIALRPVLGAANEQSSGEVGHDVLADAVAEFLIELSNRSGVGMMVFEDAQTLDSASMGVLRRLAYRAPSACLLVVCVVGAGGIQAAPELARQLEGHVKLELAVEPLREAALAELATEYLGGRRLDAELVSHLTVRSHRNPRLLLEYIDALLGAGALRPHAGAWLFERRTLNQLALPEDAAQLFVARAKALVPAHLSVLKVASVLGMTVRRDRLLALCGEQVTDLSRALQTGEELRLLEQIDGRSHVFVDERVRGWLYGQLDEGERRRLHRHASALSEQTHKGEEESVFEAARHAALGVLADTSEHALSLNLAAGGLALDRRATREALDFLECARSIAETYEIRQSALLLEKLGDAHAQAGHVDQAVLLYQKASERTEDAVTSGSLQLRIAELHMTANFDTTAMEAHLFSAWRSLGYAMPKNSPSGLFWFVFYALLATFMDWTGVGVGGANDKRHAKLTYRVLESTSKWAYLSNHFFILLALAFRLFYAGLRVGPSRELAYAYGTHCASLANMGFPQRWSDYYLNKARRAAKALSDRTAEVRVEYWEKVARAQRGELVQHARTLDELLAKHGRWLDPGDLFFAYMELALSYQLRGYYANGNAVMRRCLNEIAAKAGADASQARVCKEMIAHGELLFMRPGEVARLPSRVMDPQKDSFMWFQTWSVQLGVRCETLDHENFDEAIDNVERARRSPMTAGWQFSHYWLLKGHARLEQCFLASGAEKPKRIAQLKLVIAELRYVEKIPVYRLQRLVFQAGVHHFEGRHDEALAALGKAEQLAVGQDSPQGLYDCLRIRGRMAVSVGEQAAGARDLSLAHCIAENQGWLHRARQLRKLLDAGGSFAASSRNVSSSIHALTLSSDSSLASGQMSITRLRRDRDALLEVSLAASQLLEPAAQAVVALDTLLSLLGGERAFFFVWREEQEALVLVAARGARGVDLNATFEYPNSIVEWVREHRSAVVLNGFDEAARLGSDTAVRLGLRSMISTPVMLRERFCGVLYLDSAVAKGVFTEDDIEILNAVAHQVAVSQETARSAQREIERRELEKDLQLTAAVQALLLPKEDVLWSGDLEVAGSFEAANQSGGDFWYADVLPNGTIRVLVGDVTGHGAGAAMVSAVMAGCYRALRLSTPDASTETLLSAMDKTLRFVCEGKYTLPLSALDVAPGTGSVTWWTAAAPPILWLSKEGQVEPVIGKGLALGSEEFSCGQRSLELAIGERLLIFTDGVSELDMPGGRQLGLRRLTELFRQTHDMPLQQAREQMIQALRLASGDGPRSDDVTFVIIGRCERAGTLTTSAPT